MSEKKRFFINSIAQFFSFAVGLGITFFLTPFIVEKLGADAYGFVGLASSFVSYAQLITTALNSMAGRFITISVHKGDIESARKYFSSVFGANLITVAILSIASIAIIFHLENIIHIPDNLINDVKLLFTLSFLNFFVSLIFNVYNVCTFIKNRLDLSSSRVIVSDIIRCGLLFTLFFFFAPAVWYIGIVATICSVYVAITNLHFRNALTPELYVQRQYFDFAKIKELLSAGVWNVISKINGILGHGLDLLIANLLIGTTPMGIIAITRRVPSIMLTFYERINAVFAPNWTKFYAQGDRERFHKQLLQSIRFFGVISFIPLSILFIYCDWFYSLWLPNQNAHQLYILTIVACVDLPFAMPLQPIYNVYPIVNKIKANSLLGIGIYSATFLCVLLGVLATNDTWTKMLIIAATRAIFNLIKAVTFLPLYGAYCTKLKARLLYKNAIKSILSFGILSAILVCFKSFQTSISWISLTANAALAIIIGFTIGYFFILDKEEKLLIKNIIKKVLRMRSSQS